MSLHQVLFGSFELPAAHSTRSHRILDKNVHMEAAKARSDRRLAKREADRLTTPVVVKETLSPPLRQKIVDALHETQWMSLYALSQIVDARPHSISKHIKPLLQMGLIVKKIVSIKGQTRYGYFKLRTPEDKRDIYSETRNRDSLIIDMLQEKFCSIEELQKKTGVGADSVHKALERIRKRYICEKYFQQFGANRVFHYKIVGEK